MMPTIGLTLAFGSASCVLYALTAGSIATLLGAVLLVGGGGGLGSVLQARLMDVARDAQTLAAALNHSAFNTANALGPWLAGMAIGTGAPPSASGWIDAALPMGGLVIWSVSWWLDQRRATIFPSCVEATDL